MTCDMISSIDYPRDSTPKNTRINKFSELAGDNINTQN